MNSYAEKKNSFSSDHWHPDIPIFSAETIRKMPYAKKCAIFSEDYWELHLIAGKSTGSKSAISFASCPAMFKDVMKRLVWCAINIEAPVYMLERPTAARTRLTVGSIVSNFEVETRPFTQWLDTNGFTSLKTLTAKDIQRYADEVCQSSISRANKARRLFGLTRIWLFAPYLPEDDRLMQPPWEREGLIDLLGPANWSAENKTIPIHPQTISPLISWAIRFVNDFSGDILAAISDKKLLLTAYREKVLPGDKDRYRTYIASAIANYQGIPGFVRKNGHLVVASEYISLTAKVGKNAILISKNLKGLAINKSCPIPTKITAKVDGLLWIDYFDYYEIENYRQLLVAACVVVISYLSGMRSEECRALKRGCCKEIPMEDGVYRYEVSGLTFKDALDADGNSIHGGVIREQPWHVIKPVQQAISVMEKLHGNDILFSDSALSVLIGKDHDLSLSGIKLTKRIGKFIDWCNEASDRLGTPELKIPPDPDGYVTLRRFRRTLAWFIYRLPGGRISLGIQYGHLRGITTDGYGSRVANGLRDTFPMEEAYALADSLHDAVDRLSSGEGVSGPSADRYISGILEFDETFQGKYLTPRQAAQLRRNPALRIFDNGIQPVACCYDATKALCHPDRAKKNNVDNTPNLTRCNQSCSNVARTDKHVEEIKVEILWQKDQMNSDLTPIPLIERHRQHIASLEEIIRNHNNNRRIIR